MLLDEELRLVFVEEAQDLLRDLEAALLALDEEPAARGVVDRIFRIAHTLKGNAAMLEFTALAELAHAAESTLVPVRSGAVPVTEALVSAMLVVRDALSALVQELAGGPKAASPVLEAAWRALDAQGAAAADSSDAPPPPAVVAAGEAEINFPPPEAAAQTDLSHTPNRPCEQPEAPELTRDSEPAARDAHGQRSEGRAEAAPRLEPSADAAPQPVNRALLSPAPRDDRPREGRARPSTPPEAASIRVPLEKLDRLQNLVGELVIAQAMVTELVNQGASSSALSEAVEQLGRHCRELQDRVLGVRMLPVRGVFQRAQRLVRDLATQLGKDVVLETSGEDIELDKTVLERVGESLVHLVRNAVDHGVERPHERLDRGKPSRATVRLRAYQRGGHVFLELEDDGRGLDRARIRQKALRLGLLRPGDTPSDDALVALVFAPGFSTAESVTEVSGRGVGMDAVKRSVEALRGTLSLSSVEGAGTRARIGLPLTLSIIDGLTVRVGGSAYVLPLVSVVECLALRGADVRRPSAGIETVELRDETLRLLRVAERFGLPSSPHQEQEVLVVVDDGHRRVALAVHEVIGQQQVVVKSLEANYRPVQGLSGATVLGDGRVALIIDPAALTEPLRSSPRPRFDDPAVRGERTP